MADLVDKFYAADLSPAEEASLDELLLSSPEAADQFEKKAAEAYARYGLPDLGPDSNPRPNTRWRLRLGLLAFAVLLTAAIALGNHGMERISNLLSGFSSPLSKPPAPNLPLGKKTASPALTVGKTLSPSSAGPIDRLQPKITSAGGLSPVLSGVPDQGVPVSGSPPHNAGFPKPGTDLADSPGSIPPGEGNSALEPPSSGLSPQPPGQKAYSHLKINVVMEKAGPVAVSILNGEGAGVKSVYSGTLPAGNYDFIWDGRLDDGREAPPGRYTIETHSGTTVRTHDFLIEKKSKNPE